MATGFCFCGRKSHGDNPLGRCSEHLPIVITTFEPSDIGAYVGRRRWNAAAPKEAKLFAQRPNFCPCGIEKLRCDDCGELHCRAPGHLAHVCTAAPAAEAAP